MKYMNMNFPIDYWEALQNKGREGRLKANAFSVFFLDKERGNSNSARFYAETWGVGKSAVNNWIKEFKKEIDRFDAYWYLKNLNKTARQYSSAKNQGGQSGQLEVDIKNALELLDIGVLKNGGGHLEDKQVDKDIINKEEVVEGAIAKEFEKVFFMYSNFSNRLGDRTKAFNAYKKIRDEIKLEDLLSTISKYLTDSSVKGFYNLEKFLNSKIFLSYFDREMKVLNGGEWIVGRYDAKRNVLYTDEAEYPFTASALASKMAKNEIEFVGRVA